MERKQARYGGKDFRGGQASWLSRSVSGVGIAGSRSISNLNWRSVNALWRASHFSTSLSGKIRLYFIHAFVTLVVMKRRDFLEQWGLSSLRINLGFLEGEFAPRDADLSTRQQK